LALLAWTVSPLGSAELRAAESANQPSPPEALALESGLPPGQLPRLRGRDAHQQLTVTARLSGGTLADVTRDVHYDATPAGIVSVDNVGLVSPLADGTAEVRASYAGLEARLTVVVESLERDPRVSFHQQIVPVFTRYGCNSGGCHGKSTGQGGFRLSLLGFEPSEDYEHLVKEGRGRRLFPAAPTQSLLLAKAVSSVPHGGGQRLALDSHEYRLLARWIAQGMPDSQPSDPMLTRISVFPADRLMQRRGRQQLVVLAHYSDGTAEDVTRLAQYDANSTDMAECESSGLIRTLDLSGDVAIMARYQGQVAVFRASVPMGAPVKDLPKSRNFVDDLVFRKLSALGMPPSAVCDDATFVRRLTVDLAGRLPTLEETRRFLADRREDRRDRLIDELLVSGDHADYFANKWSAVLRNRRRKPSYTHGTYAFHDWIRESLYANKPYDQFVREILTASGEIGDNPAVAWYREVQDVEQQTEDCAQLFLGLRLQCARCHHHPFEKWSQRDYYGFAAFFTQLGRKPGFEPDEPRIYHRRGQATAVNPKTGEQLKPTGLGGPPLDIAPQRDPRQALADWMADTGNPFFARSVANRYWKHFFGRGIVDPEDDMRLTNPASNPDLLDFLARHFVESRFDLRELTRSICRSQVYQLASEPNAYNLTDKQNFSRYYPRRLNAEVLLDALDDVTASPSSFSGLPRGIRAVQLPDTNVQSYFLTVFGRPESASACECERTQDASVAQSLHLLNSAEVQEKLSSPTGRAAALAAETGRSNEDKVRDLYLAVYSRQPAEDELAIALDHLQRAKDARQAFEDILWALVNTKEFLFNH